MNDLWHDKITTYTARPAFQGSTLNTWIGFKRLMYLAEEAVLEFFRERGYGPHRLYHECGLCFEIVDSAVRIFHPLTVDDLVTAEVRLVQGASDALTLMVQFFIDRDGKKIKPLSGKVKAVLRRAGDAISAQGLPEALTPGICDEINRASQSPAADDFFPLSAEVGVDEAIMRYLAPPGANVFVWKWRIPYYYCHYWDRIQHSGYIALMEGVVPLFLADRGISIRTMLETRRWIPVVSQAQVEILREAVMEETLYTTYTVEEIFKGLTYTARMDCYVPRGGGLLLTATGRIVHGYAQIAGSQEWGLAHFDDYTMAALQGVGR